MVQEGFKVVGIRKAASKDGTRVYTTYYCHRSYSVYEQDNSLEVWGVPCEEVQTTEDFPIGIGDEVLFYYGKARGDWQPVVDFKMIHKADAPAKKEAEAKK